MEKTNLGLLSPCFLAVALTVALPAQNAGDPKQPFPGGWCLGEYHAYGPPGQPGLLYLRQPGLDLGSNMAPVVYNVGQQTSWTSNPVRLSFFLLELGGDPALRPAFIDLEPLLPNFGNQLFAQNYPCMTRMTNPIVELPHPVHDYAAQAQARIPAWSAVIAQDPFAAAATDPNAQNYVNNLFASASTLSTRPGFLWRVTVPNNQALLGQWITIQGITAYVKMYNTPGGPILHDWISLSNEISVPFTQ